MKRRDGIQESLTSGLLKDGLESANQAVVHGIAENLAVKWETGSVGFHFPVEPENGVVPLYSEMFLYSFICFDGQNFLLTTLHLDLVMFSKNLK